MAKVIQQVVIAVEAGLMEGAAVTVNDRRLAVRRLPLIKNAGEEVDGLAND